MLGLLIFIIILFVKNESMSESFALIKTEKFTDSFLKVISVLYLSLIQILLL